MGAFWKPWTETRRKITTGYLGIYAKLASSAAQGAILKADWSVGKTAAKPASNQYSGSIQSEKSEFQLFCPQRRTR
jgi:hypothetical protein